MSKFSYYGLLIIVLSASVNMTKKKKKKLLTHNQFYNFLIYVIVSGESTKAKSVHHS